MYKFDKALFLVSSSINKGISLLLSFHIASKIGNFEYGKYGLVLNFITFSSSFVSLGIVNNTLTSIDFSHTKLNLIIVKILIATTVWLSVSYLLREILHLDFYNYSNIFDLTIWLVSIVLNIIIYNYFLINKFYKQFSNISLVALFGTFILFLFYDVHSYNEAIKLIIYPQFLLLSLTLLYIFRKHQFKLIISRHFFNIDKKGLKFLLVDGFWALTNFIFVIQVSINSINQVADYTFYSQIIFVLLYFPTVLSPLIINKSFKDEDLSFSTFLNSRLNLLSIISYLIIGVLSFLFLYLFSTFLVFFKVDIFLYGVFLLSGFFQLLFSLASNYVTAKLNFSFLFFIRVFPNLLLIILLYMNLIDYLEVIMLIKALFYLIMFLIIAIRK